MTDPSSMLLPVDHEELCDLLERYFLGDAHRDRPRLLGLEFECLRVARTDWAAAPSRGPEGPDSLILALAEHYGRGIPAEIVREAGDIAIVWLGNLNFSLEPGGQIEVSLPPLATPNAVARELAAFVGKLEAELAAGPYGPLYLGHQPCTLPDDIPLRPKPRYEIMNRRLQASGRLGRHMMRATASLQVTVDYRDAAECVAMLRAALITAPLVTAIFANSPLVGGNASGYASFREKAWWDTDPSRCGVPTALLAPSATLRDYVDFALDAEVWFLRRDDAIQEVPGRQTFRQLHAAGTPLTLADFHLHASTLFPAARLRNGIEVRSADCVPLPLACAFSAIMAGLLYDRETLDAVADLHPYRSLDEVTMLHEVAARDGPAGIMPDGFALGTSCGRLLDLARQGLERLAAAGACEPDTTDLLTEITALVEAGESPAVDALRRFAGRHRPA